MIEAHKTHDLFFNIITKNKLNELLNRADNSTKYLETQINNNLNNASCNVNISSKNTHCDIYIIFFDLKGDRIGHISLHITSDNKDISNASAKNGRFHAKNNKNRNYKYTFKFNKVKDSFILLYIDREITTKIRKEFEDCLNVTLTILNEYFDPNSKYYLKHRLTKYDDNHKPHKCLLKIENKMKTAFKTRLKNTRKVHHS